MNKKLFSHIIAVGAFAVFIVLGLASVASSPKVAEEPISHSELIEVSGLSQAELFNKVNIYFRGSSSGQRNLLIQSHDQDSFSIKGKLIVDNIRQGDELYRHNSTFMVEVTEGNCRITFTEPTRQSIGFVSEQAKAMAFNGYLIGFRAVPTFGLVQTKTDAQLRTEWEEKNVFSPSKPGPERPIIREHQAGNFREQWKIISNELKIFISN